MTTNHDFIEKALQMALEAINADSASDERVELDRDTLGLPGTPDISAEILKKIDEADAFLCDFSIIGYVERPENPMRKAVSNPNVLIEFGYALRSKGAKNIIVIMNTAFGGPNDLPFDNRNREVILYNLPPEAPNPDAGCKELAVAIEEKLRLTLGRATTALVDKIISSIDNDDADLSAIDAYMAKLRDTMESLVKEHVSFFVDNLDDAVAIQDISETIYDFARMSETMAYRNAEKAALQVYKGFSKIIASYSLPQNLQGNKLHEQIRGNYRVIAHDLFVTFINFFFQHSLLDIIGNILKERIYVEYSLEGKPDHVTFRYISQIAPYSDIVYRSNLLRCIHEDTKLKNLVSIRNFAETDFFLSLAPISNSEPRSSRVWRSRSYLSLGTRIPAFLTKASKDKQYAEKIAKVMDLESVEALRNRIHENREANGKFIYANMMYPYDFLDDFNIDDIGR